MSFRQDKYDANKTWVSLKTEILKHIKGEDLYDIESQSAELAQMFDMYSGVDALHIYVNGSKQMRGVAIRVCYGQDWRNFTIRFTRSTGSLTEYEKRKQSIKSGSIYPYLTIQMYVQTRQVPYHILSCGIIKTIDLYDYIEKNFDAIEIQTVKSDGNRFLCVTFDELARAGLNLIVFPDIQSNPLSFSEHQRLYQREPAPPQLKLF